MEKKASKARSSEADAPNKPPNESDEQSVKDHDGRLTRRGFLGGVGGSAVAAAVLPTRSAEPATAPDDTPSSVAIGQITLRVNGQTIPIPRVEARTTLLDVLRNRLALTGAKPVCDRASCGACTVHMDGKAVNACCILAMDAEGHDITTVEGLADGDDLHPVQAAFIEHDALMCGFCTPGFVMSLSAFLNKHDDATPDEIRAAVSGNLCRCGTYVRVFEAGETAARRMREGG